MRMIERTPAVLCRADYLGYAILGKASVQVTKQRKEDGSASLSLCHCYDTKSGGHVLRVSCSLWVFNCTGLPIALRQSWLAEGFGKQVTSLLGACAKTQPIPLPPMMHWLVHALPYIVHNG